MMHFITFCYLPSVTDVDSECNIKGWEEEGEEGEEGERQAGLPFQQRRWREKRRRRKAARGSAGRRSKRKHLSVRRRQRRRRSYDKHAQNWRGRR